MTTYLATPPPPVVQQFFDANGNPLAGGVLSFFAAGTDTPQQVFNSTVGDVPLGTTVTLDAAGKAVFYLKDTYSYKINLVSSTGVQQALYPVDYIDGNKGTVAVAAAVAAVVSDLANTDNPAKGDAMIGVLARTGAVPTTQHEVNSRVLNIFDFLTSAQKTAVLARTTYVDCSAAIDTALARLDEAPISCGSLYFPAGFYGISTPIPLHSGQRLIGDGSYATIIKTILPSGSVIPPHYAISVTEDARCTQIKDLALLSLGTRDDDVGVQYDIVQSGAEHLIENVSLSNFVSGIKTGNRWWQNTLRNVRINGGQYGFVGDPAYSDIYHGASGQCINNLFDKVYCSNQTVLGMELNAFKNTTLLACNFGGRKAVVLGEEESFALQVKTLSKGISCIGCNFEEFLLNLSSVDDNQSSGVVDVRTGSHVSFSGCNFTNNEATLGGDYTHGYNIAVREAYYLADGTLETASSVKVDNCFNIPSLTNPTTILGVGLINSGCECQGDGSLPVTVVNSTVVISRDINYSAPRIATASTVLDLSQAGVSTTIILAPLTRAAHLTSISFLQVEAIAAGKSLPLTILSADATITYWVGTPADNLADWDVETFYPLVDPNDTHIATYGYIVAPFQKLNIPAGTTVVMSCPGSSGGAGKILASIEYVVG